MKGWAKYSVWGVAVPAVIVAVALAALYTPAVQRRLVVRLSRMAGEVLGGDLHVRVLRLRFPLKVSGEGIVLTDGTDTLAACGRMSAEVSLWPLVWGTVEVPRFSVEGVRYTPADTLGVRLQRAEAIRFAGREGFRRLTLGLLDVDSLLVSFAMPSDSIAVMLPDGRIAGCRAALDGRSVAVRSVELSGGEYRWTARPYDGGLTERSDTLPPWSVAVDNILVMAERVVYAVAGHIPRPEFDSRFIVLSDFGLEVDTLRNRGADLALSLRRSTFTERCGLSVDDVSGRMLMDSDTVVVEAFRLRTRLSAVDLSLAADKRVLEQDPGAEVAAEMDAVVDGAELRMLLGDRLPERLRHRTARLTLRADGSAADLRSVSLDAEVPSVARVSFDGRGRELTDRRRISFYANIDGELTEDIPFARWTLPALTLHGRADVQPQRYNMNMTVDVGSGKLYSEGVYEPGPERYDMELECRDLPLGRVLPRDSLGALSLSVRAGGAGLAPATAVARARLDVGRAEWRGHDFGPVFMLCSLSGGRVDGRLVDRDSALRMTAVFSAEFADSVRRAHLAGSMAGFDLREMGLVQSEFGGSFRLRIDGEAERQYAALRVVVDSAALHGDFYSGTLPATVALLRTDSARLEMDVRSAALMFGLAADERLDALVGGIGRLADSVSESVRRRRIDMEHLSAVAPAVRFGMAAGRNSVLSDLLRRRNLAFDTLRLNGRMGDSLGFATVLTAVNLRSGTPLLDTAALRLVKAGRALAGDVFAKRAAESAEIEMALLDDSVSLLLTQTGGGAERFRFGLAGWAGRNDFVLHVAPYDPVFAARQWRVNSDNYLKYGSGNSIDADIRVSRGARRFSLHTVDDSLHLSMAGINLGELLTLLPSPPPAGAVLGGDGWLTLDRGKLAAGGAFRLDSLFYRNDNISVDGAAAFAVGMSKTPQGMQLAGALNFENTAIGIPLAGALFRLPDDTLRLADGKVLFDRYSITAANGSALRITGEVDVGRLSEPQLDLHVGATDFRPIDIARRNGRPLYGTALLDIDATVRGEATAPVVRGGVSVSEGTDLTYTMQRAGFDLDRQPQGVVTFVNFNDMLIQEPAKKELAIPGVDLLLTVDIDSEVEATVNLSDNGNNRVEVAGGGLLAFSVDRFGGMNLSGRYTLSGGTLRYSPPVISSRNFAITPGSYVEWAGDVADPSFHITATERIRASVTGDGGDARSVTFVVSVVVRNSLKELDAAFDLSADDDLAIQNQLASMTREQRAAQAMGLLLYNTYTGDGATARATAENPLNAFIEKELNRWAGDNLRGVDLSFGIDTYDAANAAAERTDYTYRISKTLFGNRMRAVVGGRIATDADPTENLRENLFDDISIEYLLNRSGDLYIRLFRHTDTESILEGEVTATGVGFVVRKRLSRLGELFRPPMRAEKSGNDNENDTSK